MAHSLARMNPPCRVIFAGFESDTFTLGRNGWQIAFEENSRSAWRRNTTMLLKHEGGLTGWAESLDEFSLFDWRMGGQFDRDLPVFIVKKMSNSLLVRMMQGMDFSRFSVTETDPAMMTIREIDLAALPLFKPLAQPAKEDLIVDPATVSEMLEQIRKQQAPIQKDIRERARRREVIPVQHATIYTLPQAA